MLQTLARRVRAVCPGADVAIGKLNDKSTWRITYPSGATDAQRAAAAGVIMNFDMNAPEVPDKVALWQARAALAAVNKLEAANAAVAALGNPAVSLAWEYGNEISRSSPTVAGLAVALSLTETDVDALFVAAGNMSL